MSINFATLASGALGFTIALAWNDAVSKTIQSFFPPKDERAAARATLIYALIITIIVIFIVAVINNARRIVHRYNCRANGSDPDAPPAKAPQGLDCQECARHCGAVRFWEPGQG